MNKIENAELSDRAVNQISDVIIPMIKERDKEIERLNNIINELEKDINKRIERYDVDETINGIVTGTLKYVLDKLQELKGSDKE